jgi:prolyl oligopeptidase
VCPLTPPPFSHIAPVVDILHGIAVSDPYRWLEDQNSSTTRDWIEEQSRYARSYLDAIPGRQRIRERIRELVDVETFDSFFRNRTRYFFRKRLPGREQPSIYFREGAESEDQLLVDPATRGTGNHTAVKPVRASSDGSLLLYEVKQGGEPTSRFEILDIEHRKCLPDALPHGYLRGFAFAPDGKSFYYAHEATDAKPSCYRAVYHHVLGTDSQKDREIFCAGEDEKLRIAIVSGTRTLGFLVYRFLDNTYTDFYLWPMGSASPVVPILRNAPYGFEPRFIGGRILAATNQNAPNRKIVEVQPRRNQDPLFFELVSENYAPVRDWVATAKNILVLYTHCTSTELAVHDMFGKRLGEIPCRDGETVRLLAGSHESDEVLLERESFTKPIEIVRCLAGSGAASLLARRSAPFEASDYAHSCVSFRSKDGTTVPVLLLGHRDILAGGSHPTIMTSYGGFGVSMTPKFSVFVAFLVERGCLFALPCIRGGSEFGADWHAAARRRNRQVAYDDFLSAAEWLIASRRTCAEQLAIFGGSNSGLLVGAAMTQRPELFRAVVCMVPMLDMLRYHLFDKTHVWNSEFGSADDPEDFAALARYSPYHQVRDDVPYPATLLVSGDADRNCNPLHARKMTARLQAANASKHPILLEYSNFRGHSPVLPLSDRIEALTDRMAFLCDQLGLPV